ncbi:unnamed protein product [Rotaria sp. Silwood1]|nr:unnamed protein product [Rotaria sp. Silwood1]
MIRSTMNNNQRELVRFMSEQHQNNAYVDDGNNDTPKITAPTAATRKKNFLRQISIKAEEKVDELEREADLVHEILQGPSFTRMMSVDENQIMDQHTNIVIEPVSPNTIIETGVTYSAIKPGSQRVRWNLLFNLLLWIVVPFPFWIPFLSKKVAFIMIPSIQGVFVFMWTVIAILAVKNLIILYANRSHNYAEDIASLEKTRIRHIVAISCYKEPLELIATSVQSVANQTEVHRIIMVISFEEKTPDKEEKCKALNNRFKNAGFERIIFTIHPHGLPNEIPGKCSNSNYGLRMATTQMAFADSDMDNILVTTCDADSKFPPNYIAALTLKYLQENKPALSTIYQAPLFYNWRLDGLSFVTRVTGLLRSLLMLGALIPCNINTMSIFSYSLSLAKKGKYIHPAYQMDDIICLIRWMGVTQQRLRISMISVPVISGPTSGETIETEIIEWARQARRWTIGAAEVFHYFVIKAKRVNQKFDRLARCIDFTQSLDFTMISSNEHNYSKMNSMLNRLCFHIIPQIQHNIQSLTLDPWSMTSVLTIGNYPTLHKLTLVNLKLEMASRIFLSDSPFVHMFKHKISDLVKILSNLKYFSLTSFCITLEYDNQIVPLLRQMSQLEKLTLSLYVRERTSFIDGTHLDNDIISKMPLLHTFIFDIVTEHVIINKEYLPTSDDVRRALFQRGYNIDCYIDYLWTEKGRCHIYSLPFTMESINVITNKFFPNGVFMNVRKLYVHDPMRSIEYDFFVRISQAFPLLEELTVFSMVNQKKQPNNLDVHEQTFSIIEYSHLMKLHLFMSHVDYAKYFLLNTNTRLPRLSTLSIDYENLVNVTEDFTSNAVRANCVNLKNIIFRKQPAMLGKFFFSYFPFVVNINIKSF